MAQLGIVDQTRYVSDIAFWAVSGGLLALGCYQYLVPNCSRVESTIRIITYHALAATYILTVSGFATPLIMMWVVLMLSALSYNGKDAVHLSILVLFATAVCDVLLEIDTPERAAANALYLIATALVGYITIAVTDSEDVDRRELARSQAEEHLQRDRVLTIVNNLADAVLSTDRNGVIQIYNAASMNLLDTNTSLQGKHLDEVIRLYDGDNHTVKLAQVFKSLRVVQTRDDLRANISGEVIRISAVYSPIRSTDSSVELGSDGYIVILRDVTKQKSLEEERDEFISVVSHELRTPITIAEGTISNVQVMMGRPDVGQATLSQSIDLAHEQVLFLARMVNDLSTLSRAERGVADTPEAIDVYEMIQELYAEYAPQAQAKGLSFDLDLSATLGTVTASPLYLKELLQNFVTNAIKYTKEGGITVIVKRVGGKLTCSVKDTGIGLSKSDQAHIYEKFWRSEDYRTRETGGTGLGLYVAAKLAKKLGVTIEMTSRLNHGSTFGFSLNIGDE
jgi:signal transduction histidine kinase